VILDNVLRSHQLSVWAVGERLVSKVAAKTILAAIVVRELVSGICRVVILCVALVSGIE